VTAAGRLVRRVRVASEKVEEALVGVVGVRAMVAVAMDTI
jgi:hypothetical protein